MLTAVANKSVVHNPSAALALFLSAIDTEQLLRLVQVQVLDFNSVVAHQVESVHLEVLRLAGDDLVDAELDDGASAHVPRHERGVHGHPAEAADGPASVVEAVDLTVHYDGLVAGPAASTLTGAPSTDSTRTCM